MMDVPACLKRIQYEGPLEPSYETLRGLQSAFLLSVPFENLDIHIGRRIEIGPDHLFHKVVNERRGGFCFELNSLFPDLLTTLGFDVTFHAARMMRDGKPGREAGHMVLVVDLDKRYLVDVGNGKSCREPLHLDGSNETIAEDFRYRLGTTELGPAVFEKPSGEEWRVRFVFSTDRLKRADFVEPCHWTQTSPESIFTKNKICTLAREDGRITLMNSILNVTDKNGSREMEIPPDAYRQCLNSHFGIML